MARENNREIRVGNLEVLRLQQTVAQVRTKYLPQMNSYVLAGAPLQPIDFTIPGGTFGVYPGIGAIPATESTIRTPQRFAAFIDASVGQPLSQLYKVSLAERQARLGVDLAREEVRAKQQDTTRQVREAYCRVAQTQSQITGALASVQYLSEMSELTERRLAEKAVLLSDMLTVRARLKQQRYQLLSLQNAYEVQKEALNRLLGRDLQTAFSVEVQPAPEAMELDLESARQQALEQRPEIREARLQMRVAEMQVQRDKAEYIPDLSLQVSYLSFQNVSFLPQNAGSAGLVLTWQPFDWGLKSHRVGESRAVSQQKALTEQDARQQVILEVDQSFRQMGAARLLLEVQSDLQLAEREKLREVTDRYQQQSALFPDLLQQQSAVAQAESQYQQALAGFWTALAEFEKAIGGD
jgi:outer membrane protein TolC